MAADGLATQGARASEALVLTQLSCNILTLAPKGFNFKDVKIRPIWNKQNCKIMSDDGLAPPGRY